MTNLPESTTNRIRERLQRLYHEQAEACLPRVLEVIDKYASRLSRPTGPRWSERDAMLITYGDQVHQADRPALQVVRQFLEQYELQRLLSTIHILPFYPYSSDDGFSVIDYRQVNPTIGDWSDVRELNRDFDLMFDLVLNHVSAQSAWFRGYLDGVEPYKRYFIEADPRQDLSAVTRPRSLPLLTEFDTSRGRRHVWTTFSADQVDLNYAEPDVTVEMLDVLLDYVSRGARFVRLDAIAYLWKQIGTNCIHLPETHEFVKLMRDVLEAVAPGVILLTETNVPHRENVSYFGAGDEAHMVYQFSLPPLLLDALLSGDASVLTKWLSELEPPPPNATFFNFTASHDGVGVRPLEGIVSDERLTRLVEAVRGRGGLVSTRRNADGSDSPYELNVSYVDALGDPGRFTPDMHARRFLASQAVMLALQGIPGIYFHSLVGTPNDLEGAAQSGQPRRINRRRYALAELNSVLANTESTQSRIFHGYQHLLRVRREQPAFHPEAMQEVCPCGDSAILAFLRTSLDGRQRVLVVANMSGESRALPDDLPVHGSRHRDLLTGAASEGEAALLGPYHVAWLTPT